ncbi:MAG: hypothetical protein ABJN98_11100 [Roseibium sp.]
MDMAFLLIKGPGDPLMSGAGEKPAMVVQVRALSLSADPVAALVGPETLPRQA